MLSVSIHTLGCKLNQLESEALADAFIQAGFILLPWGNSSSSPDLLIINTCTVTSRSDQKARRIIRKSLSDNQYSMVIVTGCYARLDREKIAALDEAWATCGHRSGGPRLFVTGDKSRLLDLPVYLKDETVSVKASDGRLGRLIDAWLEKNSIEGPDGQGDSFRFAPREFSFHTRGFIKIQDGCNNFCTYCRIRLARGPSVSRSASSILAELLALEARKCWEAVLTGVNISQYHDEGLAGSKGLGDLLNYLLDNTKTIGLRLSSLEPEYIDGEFCSVLARSRIRPHFHLSVQSGSSSVLRKMGRAYSSESVEHSAALLRTAKHNPFLACDIITGFPGETEADFEDTAALCRNIQFAWIHAFPYSKRPGTAACTFQQTVPEREALRRAEILTDMARQGRRNYAALWIGSELEAVIEKRGDKRAGYCRALSENYLRLLIRCRGDTVPASGTVVRCTVSELASGAPEQEESGADAAALAYNRVV